jgi:hypothetical protein
MIALFEYWQASCGTFEHCLTLRRPRGAAAQIRSLWKPRLLSARFAAPRIQLTGGNALLIDAQT